MRKVLTALEQTLVSLWTSSGSCPTLMNLRCVIFRFLCPLAPGRIQLALLNPTHFMRLVPLPYGVSSFRPARN